MSYAVTTDVSVERSRAEIEKLISRAGASKFMVGADQQCAAVAFVLRGKTVRFTLPLPDRNAKEFTHTRRNQHSALYPRRPEEAFKAWEQGCRSRWRALCLCIKAKLEAIEAGITTFEAEFLAHFVLPNGQTFGEHAIPLLEEEVKQGRMPQLQIGFTPSPHDPR